MPKMQKTILADNLGAMGLLSPRGSDGSLRCVFRGQAEVPSNEHLDAWGSQSPLRGSDRSQLIKVPFH